MKLTLNTLQGEELFECNVDVSSSQDWSLMADNKLSITFQLEHCVNLSPGSYVDYDGVRFYLLKEFKPTEIDSATWSYNLTLFDAASWMSVTVPVNLLDGKNNPTFVYTASLREHAAIIVANLNRRMNTDQWKVGNIIDSSNITVKYDGRYCSAILQELVDDQDTEWWVDGMTLNIGRAEFGELIELGYGNGLLGNIVCDQADNMRSYAYLYPLGSTRNIDPTKYGYERLQLPNGQMYVDMSETGIAELVEERAFVGIFPRYEGAVTSVRSKAATSDNGEEFIIYYISDSDIPFNPNNYKMPGLVPNITFLSGELMGQDFEVNYDADAHEFEIITRWTSDNVTQLPGGLLTPAVGDEYVVWNITMPDEYYPKAEQEFLEAAQKYADKTEKDISIYKANLDYIEVQERGLQLRPGQKVRLISSEYFPDKGYYDSRITRITRKLWYPDEVAIDVSAVRVIGSLSRIESSLSKAETRVSQLSVSIPAIIKSTDNSLPTDSSVYTSLRIDREYLSRRKGGVMEVPLYIANTLASASWTGSKGMAFRPLQDGFFRGDIDEFHTKVLFTDEFTIAGIPFRKMDNGSLFIDANVVFGGGVTMYGTDTTPAPSIFDGLPIDGRTIKRDGNGALYVDETALSVSGGGGVADSVAWVNVTGKPTWITNTKPTYNYSEIQGTPDLSVYFLASNFTKANIKNTLGISDWALASAKPTYTASEVGALGVNDTAANTNKLGGYLSTTYLRASGQYADSLNDLTSLGIYRMGGTIKDGPADAKAYGHLMVVRSNSWDTLSQIFFNSSNNRMFVRSGSNNSYTTRSWDTLAFTSDIPSLAGYATQTFVNTAVNGVKEWVEEQQYLSEITSGMIESVLGYQPYDGDTNRLGFLTSSALNGYAKLTDIPSLAGYATQTFVNTAVNGAKEWVEEQQYLTEITSGMIESVLGYQPYDGDTNRLGFLTSSALNGYATQSWVNTALAGYLSLSGGTINGSLTVSHSGASIVVKRTQNLAALIKYENSNGVLGQLGLNTNETILFIDASGNYRTLLDSGNYTNYALSKNGGTVNGSITATSFIGNLTGNASSATKLATPRTIWGQSFDGTGNVDGPATMKGSSIDLFWKSQGSQYVLGFGIGTGNINRGIYDFTNPSWLMYRDNTMNVYFPQGNIGIGTTSPSEKLEVNGNVKANSVILDSLNFNAGNGNRKFSIEKNGAIVFTTPVGDGWATSYRASSSGGTLLNTIIGAYGLSDGHIYTYIGGEWNAPQIVFLNDGRVGIGTISPSAKLHVHGNLLTEGGITMYSQRSLKNILSYEGLSLAQLSVIKPIKFTWKDGRDNRYHVGGVADDVATVVPEVVYSANDFLTMDYGNAGFYVAASLIKPVIDHEHRIKILGQENKALRDEINQLKQASYLWQQYQNKAR